MDPITAATLGALGVAVVNMIGSVLLTWLRYYYRSHYGIVDQPENNGHVRKGPPKEESTP